MSVADGIWKVTFQTITSAFQISWMMIRKVNKHDRTIYGTMNHRKRKSINQNEFLTHLEVGRRVLTPLPNLSFEKQLSHQIHWCASNLSLTGLVYLRIWVWKWFGTFQTLTGSHPVSTTKGRGWWYRLESRPQKILSLPGCSGASLDWRRRLHF